MRLGAFLSALFMALPPSANAGDTLLSGGFIQYWGGMETWGADRWHPLLDRMTAVGLSTVVIQRLRSEADDGAIHDFIAEAPDATDVILAYADNHGMDVYVGLMTHRLNGDPRSSQDAYLAAAAKDNNAVASRAWPRYGKHKSFRGWYIPLEPWMAVYNDHELGGWHAFLSSVARHCRTLSGPRSVAFSPFIDENAAPPDSVAKIYKKMLEGTGVDVLALQDGAGERCKGPADVGPWYVALTAALAGSGTQVWANVENFEWSGVCRESERVPATWDKLKARIAAAAPQVAKTVTFDFFHYMNDAVPLDSWGPDRRNRAAALYAAYKESRR
jgi:hypothetical protein